MDGDWKKQHSEVLEQITKYINTNDEELTSDLRLQYKETYVELQNPSYGEGLAKCLGIKDVRQLQPLIEESRETYGIF